MPLIYGIFKVVDYLLGVYIFILFISVILRMVNADPGNVFVKMFSSLTEPPARWLLRRYPKLMFRTSDGSYMDLSTFVLMLALGSIRIMLPYILQFIGP